MKTRLKVQIAEGNSKLGPSIPCISLPPIKACGNCSKCKSSCYALKAWRMYKQTRAAWRRNFTLVTKHRADYFAQVNNYVTRKEPKFFRWHVSGDILDQNYLEGMKIIAEAHPNTVFLCFTKMFFLNYLRTPSNLKIVFSAWPGLVMPTAARTCMPIAYMHDAENIDSRIPADARQCPGNCESCGMCWSLKPGESVVFHKH